MPKLRLIVACSDCARQYDASGRAVGSRFHCSCGALLTVPRPMPHEAAVVRCSACGGPRQGGAAACAFCGADFTLREQDLDTLCPRCMARISGRGRFCHACAAPVLVEAEAGSATEHPCPACGDGARLISRRLGDAALAALECGRCAGLWIGSESFRLLAQRATAEQLSPREHVAPSPPPPPEPVPGATPGGRASSPQGPFYRSCPHCGQRMNRQNYGRSSGVILDVCRQDGVWFDSAELERVLAWIRSGGPQREGARRVEELREAERRATRPPPEMATRPFRGRGPAAGADLFGALLEGLGRLLAHLT